ncbi:MAG: hypothetical protein JXA57_01280 [Armatimonadetes bacterium]|nr:hypothetical protein [Armatimonadota bacterium]
MSRSRRSRDVADFEVAYQRAASWLLRSFRVNDCRGSSAWSSRAFHPLRKWSYPYPETTGYIIPTLYDYLTGQPPDKSEMVDCIDRTMHWLLELQLDSGGFPGGHYVGAGEFYISTSDYLLHRSRVPAASVFNSGQILRGLLRHYRETGDRDTLLSIRACAGFLLGCVKKDGTWTLDAYAGSSSPSYFAYVVPPLLAARQLLADDSYVLEQALAALRCVAGRQSAATAFIDATGFGARNTAFTHTVAYTLSGLLESAQLLGPEGDEFADGAVRSLECIRRLLSTDRRRPLPGMLGPGWNADRSFQCVTGDCQIAGCFLDAFERCHDQAFLEAAILLCRAATASQSASGGFPGSRPTWGRYMTLRHPNWVAKYYMDLVFRLRCVS